MPCRSDHMETTVRERQRQDAAKHLVYILGKMNQPVPANVASAAVDKYGTDDMPMRTLCIFMGEMSEEQLNRIVYDGRSAEARALADWWEEHQREDEIARKAEAKKNARRAKDFLGNEVTVGDHIFYSTTGCNAESRLCIVTRFTPKTMFVKVLKGNRGGYTFTEDVAVKNDFVKVSV
jgi:hypothetical protein